MRFKILNKKNMVQIDELKEVLGIDLAYTTDDNYLMNLIQRATAKLSSLCNRRLDYNVNTEFCCMTDQNSLYLNNWPVWEILELQQFNYNTAEYENVISKPGDTIADSVCIYESKTAGLICLLKNYSFKKSNVKFNIKVKYKSGYKNVLGSGKIEGIKLTDTVEGYDTFFTNEIRNGDRIIVDNYEYTVFEIVNDSILKFSTNITQNFQDAQYRICNIPGDLSEAILILSASAYILRKYEGYGMDQKSLNFLALTEKQIQDMIDDSRSIQVVRMRFKDFDLRGVVETYRRVNV